MSAYAASALAGVRRLVASPGELIARAGFYGVIIAVLASLWRAAAEASGGAIVGYDAAAITWYVVFSEAAVNGTKFRMIEQIGTDIGSGAFAVEMLRPVRAVSFRIAGELGDGVVRLGAMVAAGSVFGTLIAGPPPDALTFALALASALLAISCNLAAQHAFAAMAFWQHEAKGAWFLYQKLVFILGGMLLPLQIFPSWLEAAAWASPFWTMSYAPARLAAGFDEPGLVLGQAAWLVVLYAAAVAAFAAGERHVQREGG
ncbi:MAG TPA: ABC-2 family transporter protein [Actinomycetota bacterium]|nr:ABC-2 family transporter protein [Actinomycetota bacterium]